jgi:hypothetical protein
MGVWRYIQYFPNEDAFWSVGKDNASGHQENTGNFFGLEKNLWVAIAYGTLSVICFMNKIVVSLLFTTKYRMPATKNK